MQFIAHPDRETAVAAVAAALADALRTALAQGPASLALPGGTTPAPVMEALSRAYLDWARVTVLPGDERMVPVDHPRSNLGLIRRHLLQGPAAAGQTLALSGGMDLAPHLPLAASLAGMGEDGHTASLFPGADGLAEALSPDAPPVMAMRASDGEARLSLTARALNGAGLSLIYITGAAKRAVIEAATDPMQTPVAAILPRAVVHWAP